MRIGLFTYGIVGTRMTGIARYAVETTRALKRLEPSLEVVLLNPYPAARHPWYTEFETIPVPALARLPLAATWGNVLLHRVASALRLDVLHDPTGIAPFLAPAARYRRVTTVHDAIPYVYPETQPLLTRLVFRTLVRAAGITADAVITVSAASARDLIHYARLPRGKVHVVPNGVVAAAATTEPEQLRLLTDLGITTPFLLYVGALHPRKNLRRVLEAYERVDDPIRAPNLVIVGPPSWGAVHTERSVRARAARGTGVIYTGFVRDDQLDALYRHALALVFPSLYEGFGLPVLEAMARGTPVITSSVSSLPEVAGDAAVLVDPSSVDDIADAMRRVAGDAILRRELGRRGLARAELFTWEHTARATLAIYRSVLDRT